MMQFWHDLLDSFDSDGGHIVVLVGLIIAGFVASHAGMSKGDDILVGAFGALLGLLKMAGSNKDRNDSNTTTEVKRVVTTEPETK